MLIFWIPGSDRQNPVADINTDNVGNDNLPELTGKTDDAASSGVCIRHDGDESVQRRLIGDKFDLFSGNRVRAISVYLYRAFVLL